MNPSDTPGSGARRASRRTPARVVFVVDSLGLSGKTKALVEIASRLDRRRFEPGVICLDEAQGILYDRLSRSGVSVTTLECPPGLSLKVFRCMARSLVDSGPDVVHCWNPRAMLVAGAAARWLGTRAVVGSLSAFACLVPDRRYTYLPQRLYSRNARSIWRNRLAASLMRVVVAPTEGLGRRFGGYNGIGKDKIRAVGYGVDLQAPAAISAEEILAVRSMLGVAPGGVLVGSVGRLVEQKDYPTQLRAFAEAARRVPSLRMAIVGAGPLGPELRALCDALGIGASVVFAGQHDNVWPILRAFDVFVLASTFEPYGVVLLEAKAAGCAIVATRVDQVPEIMSDGRDGILTQPGSLGEMADAICRLATDPALRRQAGAAARSAAEAHHDIRAVAGQYEALYDEALGLDRSRRTRDSH